MALGIFERRAMSRRVVYVMMSGSAGGGRVGADEGKRGAGLALEGEGEGEGECSRGRSCIVMSWNMSRAVL